MENPFIKDLIIDTSKEITDFSEYIRNKKYYDDNKIMPITYLERNDKLFVYTNSTIKDLLCGLSGSAAKLYLWIQQSVEYGKDWFKFNSSLFMRKTGMSSSTLVKAKQELIDNHIIMEMEEYSKCYWINPVIMFKGNRVKKYPNNVSKFRKKEGVNSDSKI